MTTNLGMLIKKKKISVISSLVSVQIKSILFIFHFANKFEHKLLIHDTDDSLTLLKLLLYNVTEAW